MEVPTPSVYQQTQNMTTINGQSKCSPIAGGEYELNNIQMSIMMFPAQCFSSAAGVDWTKLYSHGIHSCAEYLCVDETFERADKLSVISTRHTVDHFLVHLMTRRTSLLV